MSWHKERAYLAIPPPRGGFFYGRDEWMKNLNENVKTLTL